LVRSTDHKAPPYVLFSTTPVNASLLGPNIFLGTLFSNTLSLCSFPIVRDKKVNDMKGKINKLEETVRIGTTKTSTGTKEI
jgi:hypothetical protein